MGQGEVTVRERIPADLPVLAEVLEEQQPHTGYPQRWPLPSPVAEFLTRPGELGAWVATLDDDPAPVGHVSVTAPGSGPEVDGWVAGVGRPAEELAAVSVLFVDHRVSGRGVGGALLDAAVAFIRESGRAPVLDVVQETRSAVRLYERHGWRVVGEARPWWLPTDHLPVLLMVLPDGVGVVGGAQACARK
jgi:ribosomal protein S18 acetylase RimI-like enzyme